jgi:hypothetical protein
VVASFSAVIQPPPDDERLKGQWRPLDPVGDTLPYGPGHLVAMLAPGTFGVARDMGNDMLRISFEGSVELIIAPVSKPLRSDIANPS